MVLRDLSLLVSIYPKPCGSFGFILTPMTQFLNTRTFQISVLQFNSEERFAICYYKWSNY